MITDTFGNESQLTGEITACHVVRQLFYPQTGYLKSLAICFATYRRINKTQLMVKICDREGACLFSTPISCSSIQDNEYYTVAVHCKIDKDKLYELSLSAYNGHQSQSVTAKWGSPTRKHEGVSLYIGHNRVDGELSCRFDYLEPHEVSEEVKEVNTPKGRFVTAIQRQQAIQRKVEREKRASSRRAAKNGILRAMSEQLRSVERFLSRKRNRKLSVIILNKDKPEMLEKCLRCLQETVTYEPIEYIIGDTGSTDKRIEEVYASLPKDKTKIIRKMNYHFAKNNNELAREHATGSYLLFMNNDVYVYEDVITPMMRLAMAFPVGTVGCRLLQPGGCIDHDGQILHDRAGEMTVPNHVNINRRLQEIANNVTSVQGNTGAFLLTRRELFMEAGGFDVTYGDVYQDCDYCLRLSSMGFRHYIVRDKRAVHVGSATRGKEMTKETTRRDYDRLETKWSGKFKMLPTFFRYSLITCCNNINLYLDMVSSLKDIGDVVELIPIDNRDNYFTVTQALNLGNEIAHGQYFIYCHQDVLFAADWLKNMSEVLRSLDSEMGVVGFEGIDARGIPQTHRHLPTVKHKVPVLTLDELCLVTDKRNLRFDERQNFHFYGADICLTAHKQGLKNYIVRPGVVHLSRGDANVRRNPYSFINEAEVFWNKWKGCYEKVGTTTTNFSNKGIYFLICSSLLNAKKGESTTR